MLWGVQRPHSSGVTYPMLVGGGGSGSPAGGEGEGEAWGKKRGGGGKGKSVGRVGGREGLSGVEKVCTKVRRRRACQGVTVSPGPGR